MNSSNLAKPLPSALTDASPFGQVRACAAAAPPGGTDLRLDVEDRHQALVVDLADRVELRAVHRVLVRAVLEVLVRRDVRQHLLVRHEVVVLAVLLVALRRPRRVCERTQRATTRSRRWRGDDGATQRLRQDLSQHRAIFKLTGYYFLLCSHFLEYPVQNKNK